MKGIKIGDVCRVMWPCSGDRLIAHYCVALAPWPDAGYCRFIYGTSKRVVRGGLFETEFAIYGGAELEQAGIESPTRWEAHTRLDLPMNFIKKVVGELTPSAQARAVKALKLADYRPNQPLDPWRPSR